MRALILIACLFTLSLSSMAHAQDASLKDGYFFCTSEEDLDRAIILANADDIEAMIEANRCAFTENWTPVTVLKKGWFKVKCSLTTYSWFGNKTSIDIWVQRGALRY